MNVLLPCPFCGNAPTLENLVLEAQVVCYTCRAKIVRRHAAQEDTGVPEVIAAWNRRDGDTTKWSVYHTPGLMQGEA